MSAPFSTSNSRYRLESRDHAGNYLGQLPYMNLQTEAFLGAQGQELRCDIPFKDTNITPAILYPAKTEFWFYDTKYSTVNPIFAGPVWGVTAGSSGSLNCVAQDPLSYLAKRAIKQTQVYSGITAPAMAVRLINYMNSQYATNMAVSTRKASTKQSGKVIQGVDRTFISDALDEIANINDGIDYFFRTTTGQHVLNLYGGRISVRPTSMVLEYGGSLDGYSVDYNAQTIANDIQAKGNNGVLTGVSNTPKINEYKALYTAVDSFDQDTTPDVAQSAAGDLRDRQSTKVIPSLVTRRYTPLNDFDFGSQFRVKINDHYVQIDQTFRCVGWQLSVGAADQATTVIYTKDTEGVS